MELKKYLKSLLCFFMMLIILSLLLNTIYYFDLVNNGIIKYIKIIIVLSSCFISGLVIGFNSLNKGYLNGIKLSGIIILIFFIISLVFKEFNVKNFIYYLIILLTTTFGSMVGINKKTI